MTPRGGAREGHVVEIRAVRRGASPGDPPMALGYGLRPMAMNPMAMNLIGECKDSWFRDVLRTL